MPQPLSHPDLRRRNLSLILGTVLRHHDATRKEIEQESGLSKATVSRLTEDLLQTGTLISRAAPTEPSARGRPAETLSTSASLGLVAGLSLGLRTTSLFITDLSGRELAWQQLRTPSWGSLEEALDWTTDVTRRATQGLGGPLRRVVVAIPGRAVDGTTVTQAPLFMAAIKGRGFALGLEQRLGCPIRIELDAAMVLVGLEHLGYLEERTGPVLLNASSILTMSMRRRDGTIARGLTASYGNFDLIPIETELGSSRIGDLLGAHGLLELSRRLGEPLDAIEGLWGDVTDNTKRIQEAFLAALTQVIRIVVVMADPTVIVFTGRLSPLVQRVLPRIEATMTSELNDPPELRVIDQARHGYQAAVGAAHEGRTTAVRDLLDDISREGITSLT